MQRVQELCRKLKPVLGQRIDRMWTVYLAESDPAGKADIEQTLELLAARHLGQDYQPDRAPFPPPPRRFAESGDVPVGSVSYGQHSLYPFCLRSDRLKEHILVAGRSGSGKTNLTFVLMLGVMARDIKVLALDWKRGYRDLMPLRPDLRLYTVGREVSPFRFNPLIPPSGCEPNVWIKLIVDVIASAYLGGEGVISLLVAGLDKLYKDAGVFEGSVSRWPTIQDLLAWLQTVRLRGRAALWQASAERILLAMTYGEFGAVVNTQDNAMVRNLLDHNVVLEMDGLSSNSDRTLFSEALTLYLYRHRLAEGPQARLTNLIILEEAHNLLLQKSAESRESVLENSIRMIRQYGMGYVFVDQSASLLSKVAFANSYATLALSQKLRADVQTIAGAMNLSDEQKESLSTLPVGTVIVRLADEHPEPFLIQVPRCPVNEGSVSDERVKAQMASDSTDSPAEHPARARSPAVPLIPSPDKIHAEPNPESPTTQESPDHTDPRPASAEPLPTDMDEYPDLARSQLSRDELRFLSDLSARPLSTTVARYERLHLSRRRGNAIRQHLEQSGVIESVALATRSGQVVLYQLTDGGRSVCTALGIDPGPRPRESLEHRYWHRRCKDHFQKQGYEVTREHFIPGDGAIDLLAHRGAERLAIEIETGKSDIDANLAKLRAAGFDRIILVACSPAAVSACTAAMGRMADAPDTAVQLMTWLDI